MLFRASHVDLDWWTRNSFLQAHFDLIRLHVRSLPVNRIRRLRFAGSLEHASQPQRQTGELSGEGQAAWIVTRQIGAPQEQTAGVLGGYRQLLELLDLPTDSGVITITHGHVPLSAVSLVEFLPAVVPVIGELFGDSRHGIARKEVIGGI